MNELIDEIQAVVPVDFIEDIMGGVMMVYLTREPCTADLETILGLHSVEFAEIYDEGLDVRYTEI